MKIHGLFWALVMMTAMLAMTGCGAKLNAEPESSCRLTQTCRVALEWDYTPEQQADISGFKVYYGKLSNSAPGFSTYDNVQLVAADARQAEVAGLGGDETLYFAVTAYRIESGGVNESIYSNEISINFVNAPEVQTIRLQ